MLKKKKFFLPSLTQRTEWVYNDWKVTITVMDSSQKFGFWNADEMWGLWPKNSPTELHFGRKSSSIMAEYKFLSFVLDPCPKADLTQTEQVPSPEMTRVPEESSNKQGCRLFPIAGWEVGFVQSHETCSKWTGPLRKPKQPQKATWQVGAIPGGCQSPFWL
jgi:hypothetical protein